MIHASSTDLERHRANEVTKFTAWRNGTLTHTMVYVSMHARVNHKYAYTKSTHSN